MGSDIDTFRSDKELGWYRRIEIYTLVRELKCFFCLRESVPVGGSRSRGKYEGKSLTLYRRMVSIKEVDT